MNISNEFSKAILMLKSGKSNRIHIKPNQGGLLYINISIISAEYGSTIFIWLHMKSTWIFCYNTLKL